MTRNKSNILWPTKCIVIDCTAVHPQSWLVTLDQLACSVCCCFLLLLFVFCIVSKQKTAWWSPGKTRGCCASWSLNQMPDYLGQRLTWRSLKRWPASCAGFKYLSRKEVKFQDVYIYKCKKEKKKTQHTSQWTNVLLAFCMCAWGIIIIFTFYDQISNTLLQ